MHQNLALGFKLQGGVHSKLGRMFAVKVGSTFANARKINN